MQAAAAIQSFEEANMSNVASNPFMYEFNIKKRVKMRNMDELESQPAKRSHT